MNSKPTLFFIPDISGFTKFMSETNPNFSNEVIPALLNKLVYSNKIGLKISEIEGDAVFFFKSDGLPTLKDLIDQCVHFYQEFYQKMQEIKEVHESQMGNALKRQLGLKIILHYGNEVGSVQIGNRIKLMGEDVITAHKLLKNSIDKSEYILISDELLNQYRDDELSDYINWAPLLKGESKYEHIGDIKYSFADLKPLLK